MSKAGSCAAAIGGRRPGGKAPGRRARPAACGGFRSLAVSLVVAGLSTALHAGGTDRIAIDVQQTGAVISPLLFGHNLEHTRRAIWHGISAEMVANRKFAAVDGGLAKHWWTLNGSGVSVDDKVTYAGKHAIRLENSNESNCGVWQQHDWLAFRKGTKYAFRVWTKSNTDQTLRMRVVNRAGFNNVFAGETVAKSGDWQLWSGEFTASVLARGARLEISLGTPGPIWIGAVSLMPADNFHGMRRDVVDLFKKLKPGNLRWPGGCFAEYYDWREGLLPVDQRPPIGPHRWVGLLPDSDGYDNHDIGTDEFIALCRELNAEPMITTRFSEASPEEAGSWVEYCNGAADTHWGKLRAERGHPAPYGVKCWYMGNELTGMSLLQGEARTVPKVLAGLCRPFIEAMKKADPSIKLNVGYPGNVEWLEPLFAEAGNMLDMVQTGFYFDSWDKTMADVVKTPAQTILPGLKSFRQVMDRLPPDGKRLGIAYYEWNVLWDRSGDVLGGVFAAQMLNMFCREQESLGLALASYFQPVTEGAIKVDPLSSELEPDGQVFVLYAAHQGNRLLKTPPMAADADFDLCASLTPDGKRIYVTVVNRNMAGARTLELTLGNFVGLAEAEARILVPLTLEAEGKFAQRDEKLKVIDGKRVSVTLPPCAVARLCLSNSRRQTEPGTIVQDPDDGIVWRFDKGLDGTEFVSKATDGEGYSYKGVYWAPYRCLCSRNVANLFMAGRDISVDREALGATRVMKTCGMMGEIVGKAAWICVRHSLSPRDVYGTHLKLLEDLMNQPGSMRRDKQFDRVRVVMPNNASPLVTNIVEVFARQVTQRCAARVVTSGAAPLVVELTLAPGIGAEGFRVEDRPGGGVRIVGNDERGLLYGVGKFLRTSRYDQGGFSPGSWRGTTVPRKPVRGIYFATHFNNFYHSAPVEDVQRYVEDLGLWGYNVLAVWYDMRYAGNGYDDPTAVTFRARLHAIGEAAKRLGLDVALIVLANESYQNSPAALRAEVGGMRGAAYPWNICPSKPEGMKYILEVLGQEFDWAADLDPRYAILWPYDAGGCGCAQCRPWGNNGFLKAAEPVAELARRKLPGAKIILSTWLFEEDEWHGLDKAFAGRKPFADYILAEGTTRPMPGGLPMAGFPEISMHETFPWGGFGATPLTRRAQQQWNPVKEQTAGGFPYSEGIFEDITKVVLSQLYWNDRPAEETLREYVAFEYSPGVVDEIAHVVATLEQNHHWRWWPGELEGVKLDVDWFPSRGAEPQADPGAEEAYATVRRVDGKLSLQARQSWRRRQLYLRALLDAELKANGGVPNAPCNDAFAELIRIYHAENANPAVRPPLPAAAVEGSAPRRSLQVDLAGQEQNAIKTSWPGIGCWFWTAEEFKPEGYKRFLDLHEKHSAFRLLTTSIRHPVEVTDPKVHDQIKAAAEYARRHDMAIVMDLDVRLARGAFQGKYPDEMQEIVRLRETALKGTGVVTIAVEPLNLGDHYTFGARGYDSIAARVLRVYSYVAGGRDMEPRSVSDITDRCRIEQADAKGVKVSIPCGAEERGRTACVLAAFTLFTPDVFAPHLIEFESGILRQYADVPLAGACKDEWGFPGRFGPRTDDIYFSRAMAEAYAKRMPGRDLVRDILLMVKGEKEREGERAAAINLYMEMNWQRNGEIETAFYDSIKKVFGKEAMSGTHPTWYAFPCQEEVFKNGLDWWVCKRDLAQTDEAAPFSVRTALAKKWRSPLWYNMYYDNSLKPYEEDLWRHALGGGRLNYHPLWPRPWEQLTTSLLTGKLLAADCRVRLLNYISTAPVDCPVAVVFGHPAALNWSAPGFADVGLSVANGLWAEGYYADLIPSSEIGEGSLKLASDGRLQYGMQRYAAAVLYNPQYERPAVAAFFRAVGARGKTALFRVGKWTRDFEGKLFAGEAALSDEMKQGDTAESVRAVIAHLKDAGIEPQTTCTMRGATDGAKGFPASMMPKPSGNCRLLDGTLIMASGEKDVMGDPIRKTIRVDGQDVTFDAIGVAAVRLDGKGNLEAMAGGALKYFRGGGMSVELPERGDVAIWRDKRGTWHGVLQGWTGPVPAALTAITGDWVRLRTPEPY